MNIGTYTATKIDILSKCIKIPIACFFVKHVLSGLFFMNFFKILESRIIFEYLDPKKNEKICDIACGCGEYSIKLSRKYCNVTGSDMNVQSVKVAKKLSKEGVFVISNAEKLPFKSGKFDKIVSACALEHFEDDVTAISEMYRILKPDGTLVLTVDSFTYEVSNEMMDLHRSKNYVVNYYLFSELKNKLEKCGFRIEDAKYFVNSPLSVLFLKFSIKNIWISALAFPVTSVFSIISDFLNGDKNKGIFLAVKARR